MGYVGFLAAVPWIQAFIWAFKPTNIVDVRRMPAQEAKGIDEEIARLSGKPMPTEVRTTEAAKPAPDKDEQPGRSAP
jgi:hypothetical protein